MTYFTPIFLSILFSPSLCFIEEILNQFAGGGMPGGGGNFHFEFGGGMPGGMMRQGRPQEPKEFKWPKNIPTEISPEYDWLRGTDWNWNSWNIVTFKSDGTFIAPADECVNSPAHGRTSKCKWSAKGDRIYILWGSAGVHVLKGSPLNVFQELIKSDSSHDGKSENPMVDDIVSQISKISSLKLVGKRAKDSSPCSAEFVRSASFLEQNYDLYALLNINLDTGLPVGDIPSDDSGDTDEELHSVSSETIKKQYRKYTRLYHPDRKGKEFEHHFNLIRDAYEILSDPVKRVLYDTSGMEGVRALERGEVGNGRDMGVEVGVSLSEIYRGVETSYSYRRRVVCPGCSVGRKNYRSLCDSCVSCPKEVKMVQQQMGPGFFVQSQQEIPSTEKCKQISSTVHIHVEPGAVNGDVIKFDYLGEQKPNEIPGAVVVRISEKGVVPRGSRPSNIAIETILKEIRRDPSDPSKLHGTLHVSLKESLLGFERKFIHFDEKSEFVISRLNMVTKPFSILKVVGAGMPLKDTHSEKGDLYVKIIVDYPKSISEEARVALLEVF